MKNEFIPLSLKYSLIIRKRSKTDGGALYFALIDYYTDGKKQTFESEGMQLLYDLCVSDIDEFLASKKKQSETNSKNASVKNNFGKPKNRSSRKKAVTAVVNVDNDDEDDDYDNDSSFSNDEGDGTSSDDDDAVAGDDSDSSVSVENIKPPEIVAENGDVKVIQGTLPFAFESNECCVGNETHGSDVNSKAADEISDHNDTEPKGSAVSKVQENDVATTFAKLRELYNKTGDNESIAFERWQQLSVKDRDNALTYAEHIAGKSGYRSYLYVFLRDKEWLNPGSKKH